LSQQIKRQQEAVDSSQTFLKLEQARYDTGSILTSITACANHFALLNQQTLANLQNRSR
jgi:hypothetical protein